jgi:septal ring-binding cell division protein DamX
VKEWGEQVSSQVKAPPAPLTERDAQALIRALGSGDQPKVLVRSEEDGVPAPTRGRLVGYQDGEDAPFQVVLTVDGRERELSVPAAALAVVPRTSAEIIARTAATEPPPETAPAAPADGEAAAPARAAEPKAADPKAAEPKNETKNETKAEAKVAEGAETAPARKAAPRKAARGGGGGGGGEVTITVTVSGDATTVEAVHGTKKLVKQASLPVAAGRALAHALGVEAVTDAVEGLVAEYRLAKESEAEQLRSRLAELERELSEYAGGTGEQGSPSNP